SPLLSILVTVLTAPFTAVLNASLYLKARQAGGETLREALGRFEEEDVPKTRWQMRMRERLTLPTKVGRWGRVLEPATQTSLEPDNPAEGPHEGSGLARRLGLFDATMLVMGGIIGSGIFVNPSVVAKVVKTPGSILGAWAVGGLIALAGSFIYAE